ncbi:hypothetical protein V6N12_034687 [Hibiscus sabdariffa]|uniref:Uncharacterized protein n=1 Tax=Hibiscus sabdariffa TaxID=183260 RepID=A0ABR2B8H6_9ROSI
MHMVDTKTKLLDPEVVKKATSSPDVTSAIVKLTERGESSDKSRKPIHVALSPEQEEKYASVAFYHSLMQMVDAGLTSADADML